jgi:hypothetical protein
MFHSLQLSYTTADIEKSLFYGAESIASVPSKSSEPVAILVVHGEMFVLEPGELPHPAPPLTEQSGLFRLVGLAEKVQSE